MDTALTILAVIVILIVIPVVVLVIFDRISSRGFEKSQDSRWHEAISTSEIDEARLKHPNFEVVEAFFGKPLPRSLRRLYADRPLMKNAQQYVDPDDKDSFPCILEFLPLDLETLRSRIVEKTDLRLPIASLRDLGEAYVAMDECDEEDGPVYFYYHDGGDAFKVASSITEFTAALQPADEELPDG